MRHSTLPKEQHAPPLPEAQKDPSAGQAERAEQVGNDPTENAMNQHMTREPYQPSPAAEESMRDQMMTIGMPDSDVRKQLAKLRRRIKNTVAVVFDNIGQVYEAGRSADLAVKPSVELEALYSLVFGTQNWRATAVELQGIKRVSASTFLEALVSAFFLRKIFRNDVPWESPCALL